MCAQVHLYFRDAATAQDYPPTDAQLEAAAKLDGRGLTAPRGAFADLLACCDIATTWQGDLCVSIATRKEA